MKRLCILGSTGSIGTQTLEIVSAYPEKFKVTGLAAGNNLILLKEQITAKIRKTLERIVTVE